MRKGNRCSRKWSQKLGLFALIARGQVGKLLIPVLAQFKGFIGGMARLYVIKPSATVHDYAAAELKTFLACVIDAFKKGIVHTKAMSQLLLLTEVDQVMDKVVTFQFADTHVVERLLGLKPRLDVDLIVEISI